MARPVQKFYKDVSAQQNDDGWAILLDGRQVKTPLKNLFYVPTHELTEIIVEEWQKQDQTIAPSSMPFTQFLFTTIDQISGFRDEIIAQCRKFIDTDTILFFDAANAGLLEKQRAEWSPTLLWAERRIGVAPIQQMNIVNVTPQPPEIHEFFNNLWHDYDQYALFTAQLLLSIMGSPILSFGLMDGYLSPEKTFQRAFLEEIFQTEQWGEDPEALIKLKGKQNDIAHVHRFFMLTRQG